MFINKKNIFLSLVLVIMPAYADFKVGSLVGVVKVPSAKVRSVPFPNSKYITDVYLLGTVMELEGCDNYDWCKIVGKKLYLSKADLGTMRIHPYEKKSISAKVSVEQNTTKTYEYKQSVPICIKLKRIDVDEFNVFSQDKKKDLLTQYLNTCVNEELIKSILQTISQFYINKGYITTKPYLKEQDINDEQLDISISKGVVEKIIDSKTKEPNGKIYTAFVGQKGELLNLQDLETSLEMINRVPSINAEFDIKPGTYNGSSIIEVDIKDERSYHLRLGATGENNAYDDNPYLTADASIDNLFNLNDILTFRLNGSRIQRDYQSTSGQEVNYAFPIGSYLFDVTWFNFKYDQPVLGINDTYISSGKSNGVNTRISKILFRNQKHKLQGAFNLQYRNSKNYFADQLLEISSYKTTLAQIDLTHTYLQTWGQIISTFSIAQGTDWLGARSDSDPLSDSDTKLQFTKYNFTTNLYYYLPDPNYQINTTFHIQHTPDLLYDNNKLQVGSFYTVRGYSASYYSNNGWYIRNDALKIFYPNLDTNYLQSISPYIGLDYGAVECDTNVLHCGSLTGSAIGIKTQAEIINSEFTWSRALSDVIDTADRNLFRYNLSFKF
ncbi:MAG: ShlB/FhaC/HecB family hemolysin secretion/activation protein [Sulfurimonadaceae bacterium]